MLPESPRGARLVHFCCEFCALCQEYRELRNRGFDMSLGKFFVSLLVRIDALKRKHFEDILV